MEREVEIEIDKRDTCGVDLSAVGRVVLDQLELRQLDVLVDHQGHVRVPLEDHVVRRVRHCIKHEQLASRVTISTSWGP